MDEIDRKLMTLLASDPRMHFRELADKLGVSTQAVHRRMQALVKSGVIRGITAGVSIRYLDAIPVMIFGRSNTNSVADTVKKLSANELSSSVLVGGGNYLYVVGLLKRISDLDSYTDFVKRTAEIADATVGIYSLDAGLAPDFVDGGKKKESYDELTPLDMRIIASMKGNARKPVADIASEVNVSAKTVTRRLDHMISSGSVDLVIPMDPTSCGDIVSIVHISLKDGANRRDVGKRLTSKFSPQLWYLRSFSNLPSFLLCILCTDKMNELRDVLEKIAKDDEVCCVIPNTWYSDHIFVTWRDRLTADSIPARN